MPEPLGIYLFFTVLGFVLAVIAAIYKNISYSEERKHATAVSTDTWADNPRTRAVAANLIRIFNQMPDWRIWGDYLRTQPDQLARIRRALDYPSTVCAYDPDYHLAKVLGNSGVYYLTGPNGCTCQDFIKRRKPCKHMYALALKLNGFADQTIIDHEHPPLYRLNIVTAGRFSKSDNAKARLAEKGAALQTTIDENSAALICGVNPAETKLEHFKRNRLPILTSDDIDKLFQPEQSKVSLVKEGE